MHDNQGDGGDCLADEVPIARDVDVIVLSIVLGHHLFWGGYVLVRI